MGYLINSGGENLESDEHKICLIFHTGKTKCFPFPPNKNTCGKKL